MMFSLAIAMTILSILEGLLAQIAKPILSLYIQYAILLTLSFSIFLILSTKYCKVYQELFSQIPNISNGKFYLIYNFTSYSVHIYELLQSLCLLLIQLYILSYILLIQKSRLSYW